MVWGRHAAAVTFTPGRASGVRSYLHVTAASRQRTTWSLGHVGLEHFDSRKEIENKKKPMGLASFQFVEAFEPPCSYDYSKPRTIPSPETENAAPCHGYRA